MHISQHINLGKQLEQYDENPNHTYFEKQYG